MKSDDVHKELKKKGVSLERFARKLGMTGSREAVSQKVKRFMDTDNPRDIDQINEALQEFDINFEGYEIHHSPISIGNKGVGQQDVFSLALKLPKEEMQRLVSVLNAYLGNDKA